MTIVLDLRDPAAALSQIDAARAETGFKYAWLTEIANQIEEQALPPKPPEPTGLYAVVEDAEGREWVSIESEREGFRWQLLGQPRAESQYRRFAALAAVKVLSEGVQP